MNPPPAQARSPSPPSPAMRAHLRALAGPPGVVSYRDFIDAALYAPNLGYYARADATRVGRKQESDFYTASSLGGGVMGKLVRAAAENLLKPGNPREHVLVEIAAEPGMGVFGHDAGSFAKVETRPLGTSLTPPAKAAIFANEWLDAQPFHRLVFRRGAWRELGVRVDGDILAEVESPEFSPAAKSLEAELPQTATEDYCLDLSLDAELCLRELAEANWSGCLILADYGLDWATLLHDRPHGTARAYYQHESSRDLLARPGEQDLTCHVCWDRLEKVLCNAGFENVQVERQEAFFLRQAGSVIEKMLAENAEAFSPTRQTLLELLHPTHLGHKFQILSAIRQ